MPPENLSPVMLRTTLNLKNRGKMDELKALQFKKICQIILNKRVVQEFRGGCAKVGLIIAFAALIGKCIWNPVLPVGWFYQYLVKKDLAFLCSGFILAVPVFFDTVFYLLIPIAIAMAHRTG